LDSMFMNVSAKTIQINTIVKKHGHKKFDEITSFSIFI